MPPLGAQAQTLVGLRIEGPAGVLENTSTGYVAIATFSDGNEYEVTLFVDWSVDPDTYAIIDQFGMLMTQDVPAIVIHAVFTWDEVTLEDTHDVMIFDLEDPSGDPWPMWQRTPARLGRTSVIGPQTSHIRWAVQYANGGDGGAASATMDANGRIFVAGVGVLTCVDSTTREIVWQFDTQSDSISDPTIWNGRVLFGTPYGDFHCLNAETGEAVWSFPAPGTHFGQAVDDSLPGGVVYFAAAQVDLLYARRVDDGSEVWTVPTIEVEFSPVSLDLVGRLFFGGLSNVAAAHEAADGQALWVGPTGWHLHVVPVDGGRVYTSSFGGPLHCLDVETGEVIWTFEDVVTNVGAIAIGHDGAVYIAEATSTGDLIAVSVDGQELWRYDVDQQVVIPPIVAGDGTIYMGSLLSPNQGKVHAVRSDGTALWVKDMPDFVWASPMLAPDGTLYVVCRDAFLYAFRDPAKGDVSLNDVIDGRDIRFFIEVLFAVDDDEIRHFAADMNGDGVVDVNDVPLFVDVLLTLAS